MNRRSFLSRTAAFLFSSVFGLNGISTGFAGQCIKPEGKPTMVLIIDDMGFSEKRAEFFLNIDIPMTFSILPHLPLSRKIAFKINQSGQEVMLHQPMEADNSNQDPGPGAIFVHNSDDHIKNVMKENISSIPFVSGVNNHMGSRYTRDRKKMAQALSVVINKDLFFVDSLTSEKSTAHSTAAHMGLKTFKRHVFIDNIIDERHVFSQLTKLKLNAMKKGSAIGIGHPHLETIAGLKRFLQSAGSDQIKFKHVSDLG